MKRLMPPSLIAFLQTNPNCVKADLFAIALPTGTTLYASVGQWDITVPSGTPGWAGGTTTFKATQYGRWTRGSITSEASTKLKSGTMALTCVPQQATVFPGLPVGILNAALNHLFDATDVTVYTVYMPLRAVELGDFTLENSGYLQKEDGSGDLALEGAGAAGYGNVSAGVETKFFGTITKASAYSRNKLEFECADPLYLLNQKVPTRTMQSNCVWSFCDSNCGLTASAYTVSFTASSASTQSTLSPTAAFTQPDGYFAQGVVTCLTGANAGLSQTVKAHSGGVLAATVPWVLPIAPGDTFSVIKGCSKTAGACATTAQASGTLEPSDYRIRFGGTPFTPVPSTVV